MNRRLTAALRVLALLCSGLIALEARAGLPNNGLPNNGLPNNGLPNNGLPNNGLPNNGLPNNGNSPQAIINSPVFMNRYLHAYWVSRPFNAATMNAPGNPLQQVAADPYTLVVLSYQWQLCHPVGSNATVVDAKGGKHQFYGLLGLCVLPDGSGWHKDKPLDLPTARWLSSATITQLNNYEVHNRYSLRGNRSEQLTAMAPWFTSYEFKFGTSSPVEALFPCKVAAGGRAKCGWRGHWIGLGKPGNRVRITSKSNGVKMLLQVNLGVHAANPGEPGSIAISGNNGVVDPKVEFIVPAGGTWNVQWAPDPRSLNPAIPGPIKEPALTGTVLQGGGALHFPADEVLAFQNREMYATAMIFDLSLGAGNIASIPGVSGGKPVASCEPTVSPRGTIEYCVGPDVKGTDIKSYDFKTFDYKAPQFRRLIEKGCTPCKRTLKPGQRFVVFPNAHMWLSSGWTNHQDYYDLRSCSSDLSSCTANFQGFIDIDYCGTANPRCGGGTPVVAKKCDVQSKSFDTAAARTYLGPPAGLQDASQCHIGSGGDTGYGVTTLFANYGNEGYCVQQGKRGKKCFKKPICRVVKGKEGEVDCGKDDLLDHGHPPKPQGQGKK